jgi:hypothetical protein
MMGRNRLWLLAHQDDEVLGLHLHSNSYANHVVYLTDGVRTGAVYNSEKRVCEAQMAWNKIDRNAELIFFGTAHGLKDGALRKEIDFSHLNALITICQNRDIDEIVTLQLEGGHQDHDTVFMLAEEISLRLSLELFSFPAYRSLHKKFPFYAVMSSTSKFKESESQSIVSRFNFARQAIILMKNYRTQLMTWAGLGPFVILKYLLGNPSYIHQSVLIKKSQDFPIKLLYANRNKEDAINYENFRKEISTW